MTRRIPLVIPLGLAALAAIAGCSKKPVNEQDALAAEARAAGDDPVASAAPAANLQLAADQSETKEPERASLAGSFTGAIPCAGCNGDDATLTLAADGSYTITRTGTNPGNHGSWTTEEGGSRIRLDPQRKEDGSQVWAILSHDSLELRDEDGTPLARDAKRHLLTRAH